MTAYKHSVAVLTSPYDINEAKEKRKKQLQAVWERRKVIYERYTKKRQAAEQRYKQS